MSKKTVCFLLFILITGTISAQTINITTVSASGRFNTCGAGLPGVTATLINSTGTSVAGNTLICVDPCGTTTLRIILSNVRWNQDPGENWVHGFFFPQNPGFSVSSISLPAGWSSFASCTGAPCSAGQTGGQGFYFDGATQAACCTNSDQDGIPNNNYGDELLNCGMPLSFQFDMTFCNSAITGSSLNFQLRGTADGNTGCWSMADGRNNSIQFDLSTTSCPDIYNVPFVTNVITDCTVNPQNYYATITGGCGNGNTVTWWDAPFNGNQIGTGVPFVYDPPGGICPVGTTIYASCCPVGATACANREAVLITGNCPPSPTAIFTKTDPFCIGINNGIINITPNSGGPFNVSLTGPGGPYNLTGPAPVVFQNLAPGTYNYTFTDAGGCSGSGGPILLVNNPPLFMPAVIVSPLCNGGANGSVTFNPFGGSGPYQYSDDGGMTYQTSNIFNGLSANVAYSFSIRDNANCSKDTIITLTEPAILTASITSTTPAGCSNNDGTITVVASGGIAPYNYSITSGPTINASGLSSGIFTSLANGSYTVGATDANGCSTPVTAIVSITDNMFLGLGPDVTICAEASVTFDPQTNPETNVFTWRGIFGTGNNTIENTSVKNAKASPLDTAVYELHAQWGSCERRDTIIVNVLRKPIATAGLDTAICNLTYAVLRGSASNFSGPLNYSWAPASYIEFPDQAVTRVSPPGNDTTYNYTLTITDDYGCNFNVTDQVDVRVQPPVPAYAGNDTTAVQGVPHQLFSSGGQNYLWSPAATLNNATAQNPLATLQADQEFIVRVTDFAGCIGYDTVSVKVYKGPAYYIPNAFTPNGDGINDVFRPVPVGIVQTDFFRIFNRYGETIFETKQYMKGWNGTFKGKLQPVGAYVWVIKGVDRNGKKVEMKGTVMLVQ